MVSRKLRVPGLGATLKWLATEAGATQTATSRKAHERLEQLGPGWNTAFKEDSYRNWYSGVAAPNDWEIVAALGQAGEATEWAAERLFQSTNKFDLEQIRDDRLLTEEQRELLDFSNGSIGRPDQAAELDTAVALAVEKAAEHNAALKLDVEQEDDSDEPQEDDEEWEGDLVGLPPELSDTGAETIVDTSTLSNTKANQKDSDNGFLSNIRTQRIPAIVVTPVVLVLLLGLAVSWRNGPNPDPGGPTTIEPEEPGDEEAPEPSAATTTPISTTTSLQLPPHTPPAGEVIETCQLLISDLPAEALSSAPVSEVSPLINEAGCSRLAVTANPGDQRWSEVVFDSCGTSTGEIPAGFVFTITLVSGRQVIFSPGRFSTGEEPFDSAREFKTVPLDGRVESIQITKHAGSEIEPGQTWIGSCDSGTMSLAFNWSR